MVLGLSALRCEFMLGYAFSRMLFIIHRRLMLLQILLPPVAGVAYI